MNWKDIGATDLFMHTPKVDRHTKLVVLHLGSMDCFGSL